MMMFDVRSCLSRDAGFRHRRIRARGTRTCRAEDSASLMAQNS